MASPPAWLRGGLLAVVSLCLAVLLCEAGARLLGLTPNAYAPNRWLKTPWADFDAELGWRNRGGECESIEHGHALMHFTEAGERVSWPTKKNAPLRGLTIGCSWTQGYGIGDRETLAWRLNDIFPGMRFENFGTGGYGTYQSLLRLKRVLAESPPDLVIYGFIPSHELRNVATYRWVNAMTDFRGNKAVPPHVLPRGNGLEHHDYRSIGPWPLERHSVLVSKLHDAVLKLEYGPRASQAREVTLKLLGEMHAAATQRGSAFLVLFYDPHTPEAYTDYCEAQGIDYLACGHPEFDTNPALFTEPKGHPSGQMTAAWAECLRPWIAARFPAATR